MISLLYLILFAIVFASIIALVIIGFRLADELDKASKRIKNARDWVVIFMVNNNDGTVTLTPQAKELLGILGYKEK